MDAAALIDAIRNAVPDLQALYLFGSAARGDAGPESDIDLALLTPRALAPRIRWDLQERLAVLAGRNVDVVDLRHASAVMRVNVLDDGQLLLDLAPYERALFEATALADYARLQEERREILEQIARDGHVYGFRNVAVHDYQNRNLDIVRAILQRDLDDLLAFARGVLVGGDAG